MYTQTSIVLYNRRLGANRRDDYVITRIDAASLARVYSSTHSDGVRSQTWAVRVRIPWYAVAQDGRTYVPASTWKQLDDETAALHWTLQTGDEFTLGDDNERVTIKEYADNTSRGSDAVRHWRIGGE